MKEQYYARVTEPVASVDINITGETTVKDLLELDYLIGREGIHIQCASTGAENGLQTGVPVVSLGDYLEAYNGDTIIKISSNMKNWLALSAEELESEGWMLQEDYTPEPEFFA